MAQVILALGGNLGNVRQNFSTALAVLEEEAGIVTAQLSGIYKTRSLLRDDQPDYLNMAALINTSLGPLDLLGAVKAVELRLGRTAQGHWQQRPLDIDIIDYEGLIIDLPGLVIPHREMAARSFVLYPLREIYPDYIHPVTGAKIEELIQNLSDRLNIEIL